MEAIITFAKSALYHPFLMLQSLKKYNVYLIRILYMSMRHMSGKCYYTALHKNRAVNDISKSLKVLQKYIHTISKILRMLQI